jgi:hypothetical protein
MLPEANPYPLSNAEVVIVGVRPQEQQPFIEVKVGNEAGGHTGP